MKGSLSAAPDKFVMRRMLELRSIIDKFGGDHPALAEILNSLGVYHHLVTKEHDESLRYHEEALALLQSAKKKIISAPKGVVLNDLINYCPSPESCTIMTSYSTVYHLTTAVGVTLMDIGSVLAVMGNKAGAISHYLKAVEHFRSLGLTRETVHMEVALRRLKQIDPSVEDERLLD